MNFYRVENVVERAVSFHLNAEAAKKEKKEADIRIKALPVAPEGESAAPVLCSISKVSIAKITKSLICDLLNKKLPF